MCHYKIRNKFDLWVSNIKIILSKGYKSKKYHYLGGQKVQL